MANHEHHDHEHDDNGGFGMALGFRIFDDGGKLFLAEAEITPYVDEPDALGATLVFHPLDGIDPTTGTEELDWPAWPIDVDDDLTRNPEDARDAQFQAILRQLSSLSETDLRSYLNAAREQTDEE
jgi:hypothetical protein